MKKVSTLLSVATLLFTSFSLQAADYYWVGGSGNWNDLNKWATTSGNTANSLHSVVPGLNDNVIFDDNSGFTTASLTVVATAGSRQCGNFIVSTTGVKPTFTGEINVAGNFDAIAGTGLNATFVFTPPTGTIRTIRSNGNRFRSLVRINGAGTLQLVDPAYFSGIDMMGGTFDTNNQTADLIDLRSWTPSSATKRLRFGSSTIRTSSMIISDTHYVIEAGTSHLIFQRNPITNDYCSFWYKDDTFHNITFEYIGRFTKATNLPLEARFNDVVLHKGLIPDYPLIGVNSFGTLTVQAGTLPISPGSNTNIIIRGGLTAAGAACGRWVTLEAITSPSVTDPPVATVTIQAGATVNVSRATIKGINKTGSTHTATQSIDRGGNTGWTFTAPSSNTYYWIGASGNWFDPQRWSTASGGAPANCVPSPADHVVFDANSSFAGATYTVTIDGSAGCRNFTIASTSPALNLIPVTVSSNEYRGILSIYGSAVFRPNALITLPRVSFVALPGQSNTITSNGMTFNSTRYLFKEDAGTLIFTDPFEQRHATGTFAVNGGILNTGGNTVRLNYCSVGPVGTLQLGASSVYLSNFTAVTNSTILPGTSHLYFEKIPVSPSSPWLSVDNHSLYDITVLSEMNSTSSFMSAAVSLNARIVRLQKSVRIFSGNFTFQELHLTPGNSYIFPGAPLYPNNQLRVTGKFQSVADGCNGWINLQSRQSGTRANLNLTGATVQIAYNNIKDVAVTPATTATSSIDQGNNTGWTFTPPLPRTLYWIGGSGNWTDGTHWSLTSGGVPANCIPSTLDHVFFDAGSGFTATSKTVTIDGDAFCNNLTVAGSAVPPSIERPIPATNSLNVYGSMLLQAGMVFSPSFLRMRTSTSATIRSNGVSIGGNITQMGPGTVGLLDPLSANGSFQIHGGTFNSNNHTITAIHFGDFDPNLGPPSYHTVNLGSSTVNTGIFYVHGLATFNAGTSHIRASHITTTGGISRTFYNATFTGQGIPQSEHGTNHTFNDVVFLNDGSIHGSHTFRTLQFTAGKTYTIASGSTQRVNTAFYPSGNPCNRTIIQSSTPGTRATIYAVAGSVNYNYVSIKDIYATRAFAFERHSVDAGNNGNMTFASPNLAAPIIGLGPDVSAVVNTANPYTLNTTGFYPNPTTTFLWDDGSTGATRTVTAYGTYQVTATYADGCTVTDRILVSPKVNVWVGTIDTDWNKAGNWRANVVPGNDEDVVFATVINHTHEAVNNLHINGDRRVNNLLNESSRALVVTPLHHLRIVGLLTVTGGLPEERLIVSSDASGSGSLTFHQPSANNNVRATVQLYSKARTEASGEFPKVWQYFGVPVQSVTVSPTFNGSTVRQWVESQEEYYKWVERSGTHAMLPFDGYEIVHPAPRTISIKGTLVTTDQSRTLVTSPVRYGGQHVLSNPFTAAAHIPWITFGANTDATVYLYHTGSRTDWLNQGGNTTIGTTPGRYLAVPKANAGVGGLPDQIPPMQGFLVRAQNGVSGSITLPYASVVKNTAPMRAAEGEPFAEAHPAPFFLRVEVAGERSGDRVWLFEHPEAGRGFDNGRDGAKILSSERVANLYVLENGLKYQVNTNAGIDGTQLVLTPGEDAAYLLSVDMHNAGNRYRRVVLRDLKTRSTTDLLAGGTARVNFAAGETERRFVVEAELNREALASALHAYADEGGVVWIGNRTGLEYADVELFDVAGRRVHRQRVRGEASPVDVRLQRGVYVVRMDAGAGVVNGVKVTVR